MMEKRLVKKLTPGQIIRFFGLLMAIFLVIGGFLYWQDYIKEPGLILMGVIAIVAGASFTIGLRVAQIDGFLDGYARGKNEFDKKKV